MNQPETLATEQRYAKAAQTKEPALCCPVDYDPSYLKAIPQEVIEKDYGCGDPSKYLQAGETVLDLGSGTGKICFIAAQVVGPQGKVIGVDMTDAMLEVARRNAPVVAENIGYTNVEFRKGMIQDLKTCPEGNSPLIADESIDVVVSNCVLNLVEPEAKKQLFTEIFRVLKKGGRAVISDIVSDQPIPEALQKDPELWSGCLSGALTKAEFMAGFLNAGFDAIKTLKFEQKPWQTIAGINFHSMTVEAAKAATDCQDSGGSCCC